MNELQIFDNAEFGNVRIIQEGDKALFCGSDVAKALGYAKPNNALSTHCKGALKRGTLTNGGMQELVFIPEGDVYRLITHSKLPSAERFEKWVFDDVLPTIRKHGVYAIDEMLANPDAMIAALQELKAEREKTKMLQETVAVQTQQIAEMKPKASYYDVVLNCKDLVATSVIAKDYGWSATKMNRCLNKLGVQYKQGKNIWLLYQKYADKGYTSTKTYSAVQSDGNIHTVVYTCWTQKGRLFIYETLKREGVLPMIERTRKKAAA